MKDKEIAELKDEIKSLRIEIEKLRYSIVPQIVHPYIVPQIQYVPVYPLYPNSTFPTNTFYYSYSSLLSNTQCLGLC